MNLIKKMISDKNEFVDYQLAILNLFRKSYGRDLHLDIWKWAYLQNVNGNPIVSLYFDGGKLVAHYAVIPVTLEKLGCRIRACLSMTTMVDPDYQLRGLFGSQAEEVYEKAAESGIELVYGFPNRNSAPGFKKKLSWILDEKGCIVCLDKYEIAQYIKTSNHDSSIAEISIRDEYLKWRLRKPDTNYFMVNKSIFKKYQDTIDLIYLDNISDLEDEKQYNLYIPNQDDYQEKYVSNYVFGFRVFNDSLKNICFKKDLILSDVF